MPASPKLSDAGVDDNENGAGELSGCVAATVVKYFEVDGPARQDCSQGDDDLETDAMLQDVAIMNLLTLSGSGFDKRARYFNYVLSNSSNDLGALHSAGHEPENVSNASLQEMYRSVPVAPEGSSWLAKLWSYLGPGMLIAVGYMDPGNWATDMAGGSAYNNKLLFIILISNLMAMFLQGLAMRLGTVSRLDLAQVCRLKLHPLMCKLLWIAAECAIAACDLAEVIGSAIAMKLLFGLPVIYGCIVTAADVLLLMFFAIGTMRRIEAFVALLIAVIFAILCVELAYARPDGVDVLKGTFGLQIGSMFSDSQMLMIAIGMIGATVMPHNLYLHSSIVLSRDIPSDSKGVRQSLRFGLIDSTVSLSLAFLINASLVVLASSTFYRAGETSIADLQDAYHMLGNVLGERVAPILFGVALLAAGQQSTLTGTLAGQIVMDGFLSVRLKPVYRRLISRLLAVVPAVVCLAVMGDGATNDLLVYSQVVLSFQLPFAMIPLVVFTSSRSVMGDEFVNAWYTKLVGSLICLLLCALNVLLIVETFLPPTST